MIDWLNRLPERIQVLILLLSGPALFAVFWFQNNVLFPEPECTLCGPLTQEEQRWLDQERDVYVGEILRDIMDSAPAPEPSAN